MKPEAHTCKSPHPSGYRHANRYDVSQNIRWCAAAPTPQEHNEANTGQRENGEHNKVLSVGVESVGRAFVKAHESWLNVA